MQVQKMANKVIHSPDAVDPLIPAKQCRAELGGQSPVTWWRWKKRGLISPIAINGKDFLRRSDLEAIKDHGLGKQ
jgi:hypothetical protein